MAPGVRWGAPQNRRITAVAAEGHGDAVDVVIVGGGAIGLATAWEAAGRGLRVTVVDPTPGKGASWVAAGMLAPVGEAAFGEEELVNLLCAAGERWPQFAARLEADSGREVGFRTSGSVVVALDASDRAAVDQLVAFQQSLGLRVTPRSARECRELVPALSPGIRGGAEVPDDHQVDNRRLVAALLAACEGAGVVLRPERVAEVVLGSGGEAAGVRTEGGAQLGAGAVVLAAGAATAGIGGVPDGVLPPVRPVKGHVVRLRWTTGAPSFDRIVRGLAHGRPCYLVPRTDGSVVLGATSEERGFDRTVQVGAVYALLEAARLLLPGLDELELVEPLAGLRPGSPDNAPWVGPTAVPGLVVATGHYRNGILLTPITADAVATYLAEGTEPAAFAAFPADRRVGVP